MTKQYLCDFFFVKVDYHAYPITICIWQQLSSSAFIFAFVLFWHLIDITMTFYDDIG